MFFACMMIMYQSETHLDFQSVCIAEWRGSRPSLKF
jgi:hypothetical protein